MGGVVQSVEDAGQSLINDVSNVGVGIDKGVRNTVPGGWGTLAATAAAIATANPELIGLSSGTSIAPEVIAAANASEDPIATLAASQGWTPAQTAAIESAATTATTAGADISSNPVTQQMLDFANARPDPIQAMSALQNMTPTELAAALGPGAGVASGLGGAGNALATIAAVKTLSGLGGTPTTGASGTSAANTPANSILNITAPNTNAGIAQLAAPSFQQINPIANPTLAQVAPINVPNSVNAAAPVATSAPDQYVNQYLTNQQLQAEFPTIGKALAAPRAAAEGGIMQSYAVGGPIMQAANLGSIGGNPMYPQSDYSQNSTFNNPNNIPLSTNMIGGTNTPSQNPINTPVATNMLGGVGDSRVDPYTGEMKLAMGGGIAMAAGGASNLGGYSDGGRLLKGPGDGMSDNIPASIANKQPARLADGEFVVPADVVSHLGNGSTDAGAKQLYAMMDRIRKARTGRKSQGKQIKAQKYLPK